MKKITLLFTTIAFLGPNGAKECLADYKDLADQVQTVADFWIGGSYNDTDGSVNHSLAEENSLSEAAGRAETNKASEYYSLESSASGGVLLKGSPLPNRYHLEFDYYNDNDWFGDLRYSYKDYLLLRLLPRRLTHNLDNLTLFDFAPASPTTGSTDIRDQGINDYGLRIDIDEVRLRLKTPNYPLHVYGSGEVVRKEGNRQARFLGGDGYRGTTGLPPGQVRASEAREVDQETRTMVVGTNAHLGLLEFDVAHKERRFENDLAAPTFDYNYVVDSTTTNTFTRNLHVLPELKATTNTLKIHTSHTGRVFASATFSEMKKSNETSGAEAKSSFGYGEISWLPVAYLSLGAKFRHQKNETSAPATVAGVDRTGASIDYVVNPGVESQTDTAIFSARYSLIPKTSTNLQYTQKVRDVENDSALFWSQPRRNTKDIYEFGFTNWAVPRLRATVKLAHIRNRNGYGTGPITYEPVSIDPERTNQGTLGLTLLVTPRVTAFVNGFFSKEESNENQLVGVQSGAKAEALNQQHTVSMNFAVSEKISISPSYTFMSWEQKRDLVWDANGTKVFDPEYTNKQKAQVFALALNAMPTKRLNINAAVDYTIAKGQYDPSSPIQLGAVLYNAAEAAAFSQTNTEELNLRLDTEYDLGRGWGLGLDLRYVDWKDDSTDNPSDGIFYGGLFKVSKKLFY